MRAKPGRAKGGKPGHVQQVTEVTEANADALKTEENHEEKRKEKGDSLTARKKRIAAQLLTPRQLRRNRMRTN